MPLQDAAKCTGNNKDGSKCKAVACKGRDFCRKHGGKARAGIAHSQYKDGHRVGERAIQRKLATLPPEERHRYTTHLPGSLQQVFESASTDVELHSLRHEIALCVTLLMDLIRRRHECGDPGQGWLTLGQVWRQLMAHKLSGNVKGLEKAIADISLLMEQMQVATSLDSELREQMRLLADLRIKEHKRLIDLESHISADVFRSIVKQQQLALRTVLFEHLEQSEAETLLLALQRAFLQIDMRTPLGATPSHVIDVTPHPSSLPTA